MAKSKRSKVVHLTKTAKKGKEHKVQLVDKVREAASTYSHIYLFKAHNMRNTNFKTLRNAVDGRFFIGKNRVLALALGSDASSECLPGVSAIARALHGDLGLLFTNSLPDQITDIFNAHEAQEYSRTSNYASMSVVIDADPAGLRSVETGEPLSATLESQLRQAGMPTKLSGGAILLATGGSYTVCNEGDQLTANQARILKVFGIKMALFRTVMIGHYHDGVFEEFKDDTITFHPTKTNDTLESMENNEEIEEIEEIEDNDAEL